MFCFQHSTILHQMRSEGSQDMLNGPQKERREGREGLCVVNVGVYIHVLLQCSPLPDQNNIPAKITQVQLSIHSLPTLTYSLNQSIPTQDNKCSTQPTHSHTHFKQSITLSLAFILHFASLTYHCDSVTKVFSLAHLGTLICVDLPQANQQPKPCCLYAG